MLKQVLWQNRSKWQIWGASTGVFVGLLLLLFAMQVYLDVQTLVKGARDNNFLVLNKKVKGLGSKGFSTEDIDSLSNQSFVKELGVFESNRYEVYAQMKQLGFSTYLFFQSIPKSFLDVDTTKFSWKEGDVVPVILSNDYLTLYNFGFGASQGLPKMDPKLLKSFEFKVEIGSRKRSKIFKARIYDFTRNVNSILVPEEFMNYANREFGRTKEKDPNQVIISTDNPYSRKLENYLETRKLEISRGGLIGGELKSALYLLIALVLGIGVIIIGLSLLVFVLNFQLLISQAKSDIQLLIQLGYKDSSITQQMARRLIGIFILIATLVFTILFPVKYFLTQTLIEQGYELSNFLSPMVIGMGVSFCVLFVWVNYMVIRKNVRQLA